jgi:hypothetical protein
MACACAATAPRLLYATKTAEWNQEFFFRRIDPSQVMMVEAWLRKRHLQASWRSGFSCEDEPARPESSIATCPTRAKSSPIVTGYGIDAFRVLVREEFFRRAPRVRSG